MNELKKILELASGMALVLMRSGAEISRVEETIQRIARYYKVQTMEMFIITNGLFINMQKDDIYEHISIRHVPEVSANMEKICEINNLSREIEEGKHTLSQALERLEYIEKNMQVHHRRMIFAAGIGAGAFCLLFGGTMRDSFGAFICGFVLWMMLTIIEKYHLSKVLVHICGAFLATTGCVLLYKIGLVENFDKAAIGAIIPLIPGVAFTNGVRDIADADYISGGIRIMDAVMIFICIAAGVGVALRLWHM